MELHITPLSEIDISNALKENRTFDISFLLKSLDFFSKDVKQKIIQQQFKINDEPLTMVHLKCKIIAYDEAGEFIFNNISFFKKYNFFSFDEIFKSDVPKLKQFQKTIFENLYILKLSKKKIYVIKLDSEHAM